jgi:hypothetical protein
MTQQRIGPIVLQLRWNVAPHQEDGFNRWYDEEHLADMVHVPGIHGGRRLARVDGIPYTADTEFGYITVYQIDSETVFATPSYLELGKNPSEWTRKVAFDLGMARDVLQVEFPEAGALPADEQPAPGFAAIGQALLHITMDVDRLHLDEVRRWHTEEHMPAVAATPGVVSARRFVVPAADPTADTARLVIHYELADVDVATSPALFASSAPSEWRHRLEGSFRSAAQVYRQVYPASGALEV